jgi:predicted glycosyltransferase
MRGAVTGSVLFYVQHLLGIGHLRRALLLTDAMTRAGLAVTLVTGGEPLPEIATVAAARVVQLPPVRASDASFKNLVRADGLPPGDALWAARRDGLLAAFAEARPDAVIIEAYPFGRRPFRRELDPLIAAAHARNPRTLVICSLRDIVVAPPHERRGREIVERVRADFDAVLVHGDPHLIGLETSFPLASQIADRLVYTGYVTAPEVPLAGECDAGAGEVLVSAGGGAVGGVLMRTALAARRRGWLADAGWRLLAGPNLPAGEFSELAADLPGGVAVERYRPDFAQLLRRCRVSVSQAGYNTVLDVIAAGPPAVLAPFAELRETEQALRAERLAASGVVELLPAAELGPDRLGEAIERAVLRGPAALRIDTGGAPRSAEIIAAMISNRTDPDICRKFNMPASD